MADQVQLIFGDPDAAAKFEQRHPLWPDRFVNLVRAIDMAFTRVQTMSEACAEVQQVMRASLLELVSHLRDRLADQPDGKP